MTGQVALSASELLLLHVVGKGQRPPVGLGVFAAQSVVVGDVFALEALLLPRTQDGRLLCQGIVAVGLKLRETGYLAAVKAVQYGELPQWK